MPEPLPEVWLRGPIDRVPPLLQPVAHALLQAGEEIDALMADYPEELVWTRPAGLASVGFHLQHLTGVVDRLFTYARDEPLTTEQREALRREGEPPPHGTGVGGLVDAFHRQVEAALEQLRATDEASVTQPRAVGRKKLPSTVLGLLVHSAEHAQRHVGQLLVTARVQRDGPLSS